MRDIDKALISLPVLAVAVVILLAANADPSFLGRMFTGPTPLRSERDIERNTTFDLSPYQNPPMFPDRQSP